MMPYKIEKRKGPRPWKIINKTTSEVVGTSVTKEKAIRSARARMMAEREKKR